MPVLSDALCHVCGCRVSVDYCCLFFFLLFFFFFFSSRRRHTRYWRDWSSDVCSSDLRGGRALAIEGVLGEPDTYYFGAVAGGVWKTTDGGANWTPLFDKQDISSIGAIAVAPSDHNVVYAGTGEEIGRASCRERV